MTVTFTVTNTGTREGEDVPQLYLTAAAGDRCMQLLGFERVSLRPGESVCVTVSTDPRLLGRFHASTGRWRIEAGRYRVALGRSATDLCLRGETMLGEHEFGR